MAALADVSIRSDVNQMFDEAVAAFERVDVLINNAGQVGPSRHFFELSDDEFQSFLSTNVVGY